ncbi:MAG: BlaI/MecI/CopY family transcriptional regulator [Candidatus Hydrothermarchaeota archaeon]
MKIDSINLGKEGLQSILGPLETEIMEIVWEKGEVGSRDVFKEIKKKRDITQPTVAMTLDKLYEKGFVDRKIDRGKGGLRYTYWPTKNKKEVEKSIVKSVLDHLLQNFKESTIAYLSEKEKRI